MPKPQKIRYSVKWTQILNKKFRKFQNGYKALADGDYLADYQPVIVKHEGPCLFHECILGRERICHICQPRKLARYEKLEEELYYTDFGDVRKKIKTPIIKFYFHQEARDFFPLVVVPMMNASSAVRMIAANVNSMDFYRYSLMEYWREFEAERMIEDHEIILSLRNVQLSSRQHFFFMYTKDLEKYDYLVDKFFFFIHPKQARAKNFFKKQTEDPMKIQVLDPFFSKPYNRIEAFRIFGVDNEQDIPPRSDDAMADYVRLELPSQQFTRRPVPADTAPQQSREQISSRRINYADLAFPNQGEDPMGDYATLAPPSQQLTRRPVPADTAPQQSQEQISSRGVDYADLAFPNQGEDPMGDYATLAPPSQQFTRRPVPADTAPQQSQEQISSRGVDYADLAFPYQGPVPGGPAPQQSRSSRGVDYADLAFPYQGAVPGGSAPKESQEPIFPKVIVHTTAQSPSPRVVSSYEDSDDESPPLYHFAESPEKKQAHERSPSPDTEVPPNDDPDAPVPYNELVNPIYCGTVFVKPMNKRYMNVAEVKRLPGQKEKLKWIKQFMLLRDRILYFVNDHQTMLRFYYMDNDQFAAKVSRKQFCLVYLLI